ncbi:MAG: DUF1080 domain-containing protein [Acidobacteria bacterium]|nr:DUF1080 domain-containing protein [Acidobacteriota bacterium]
MRRSLLLLALPLLLAAQTPRNRAPLPNEQWVSMFNGTDLTGWEPVGVEKWTVEDGAIHGVGISKAYGYLQTTKEYKDFWMSLRFKFAGNGNSGLFCHTRFKPGTVDVSQGMQFEMDRTENHHTGGLYGDGRGWIAWPSPEYEYVLRPTDWNDMLVKVEGNHFVCILNGIKILDYTDPSPKSFDGTIALQLHAGGGGNMWFKDLHIRDLSQR